MRKIAGLISLIIILSSCSVHVPVIAKIDKGSTMQGEATGSITGEGTFSASNLDGLTCHGTYNSLEQALTISGDVQCSDGRFGKVLITRDTSLRNGSGQGKLNDGSKFKFVFGQMTNVVNF